METPEHRNIVQCPHAHMSIQTKDDEKIIRKCEDCGSIIVTYDTTEEFW